MRVLADENIPLLDEFFASFGEVKRLPGREMTRDAALEADVLLVRSVTAVNADLLAGTPVRFVGTCTIGTDHLDTAFLAKAGIHWASAPGCNSQGVVDYVLGALLVLSEATGFHLEKRTFGVIGAGAVGGQLVAVLKALGLRVLVCDPPRQRCEEGGDFSPLQKIVAECDVISLHTPLIREGEDVTYHLLGRHNLPQLKTGCWLLNASRGEVIDNRALHECLTQGQDLEVVLDVWENEPIVSVELATRCRLATPHIAGYSLDGKLRGTAQIYQAFCAWLGVAADVNLRSLLPALWLESLRFNAAPEQSIEWWLAHICWPVYDPRTDDAAFRKTLRLLDEDARRLAFDTLRKHYPMRREVPDLTVELNASVPSLALQKVSSALGVRVHLSPA